MTTDNSRLLHGEVCAAMPRIHESTEYWTSYRID